MTRVLLIHNPGAARTKQPVLRSVLRVFSKAGWSVEVAATGGPGDAAGLARQGVEAGADVVAVYGGDGTVIQAFDGIRERGVPMGLIPGGTGNLLAGNLGIPRSPARAARAIVRGVPRTIDLGRMQSGADVRYFAVACGAGFDAQLMAGTAGAAKRSWGMAAYVAKALKLLRSVEVVEHRITIDGVTSEVPAATVMVANCGKFIPPYVHLKAGIAPDDGLLDVVALRAHGMFDAVAVMTQLVTGWSVGRDRIWYARGQRITLEAARPRPTQLDGEPVGVTPFTADVIPNGMQVIVPEIA